MNSSPVQTPIRIDGSSVEWQNYPMLFIEEQDILIGSANNDSMLYLTVITNNRALIRKIQMRGFRVWLDNSGNESKNFGFEYPVANPGPPPSPASTTDIITLSSDPEDRNQTAKSAVPGVQVAMKDTSGRFCYEIRIPLNSADYPEYSLATTAGQEISIGFELPQRAFNPGEPGTGAKPTADRTGSRRQGGGGGRPGGGRASRPEGNQTESLELWLSLSLAENAGEAKQ